MGKDADCGGTVPSARAGPARAIPHGDPDLAWLAAPEHSCRDFLPHAPICEQIQELIDGGGRLPIELEQQIADKQAGGLGRARWRDADDQQRPLASVLLL